MSACDLIGPELDRAVADALGAVFKPGHRIEFPGGVPFGWMIGVFSPSTDWSHGGPLIDKYQIWVAGPHIDGAPWKATLYDDGGWTQADGKGGTALIAACRAIVAAMGAGSDT